MSMFNCYNRVILIGNVSTDPWCNDKETFAAFNLAVDCQRYVGDEKYEDYTIFKRCLFKGWVAKVVKNHVKKGKCVLVEGKLAIDIRTDRTSGEVKEEEVLQDCTITIIGRSQSDANERKQNPVDDMPYQESAAGSKGDSGDNLF